MYLRGLVQQGGHLLQCADALIQIVAAFADVVEIRIQPVELRFGLLSGHEVGRRIGRPGHSIARSDGLLQHGLAHS